MASRSGRRFDRTIRLLLKLQAGDSCNARKLAKKFGVTRRTIFRDLDFLREVGVEVIFDEQHDGYRLAPHSRCGFGPGLTSEELLALLVAAGSSSMVDHGLYGPAIKRGMAKLIRGETDDDRRQLLENVAKAASPNTCRTQYGDPCILAVLLEGVGRRRIVHVRFRHRESGSRDSNLAVYRLKFSAAGCEIVARCSPPGVIRRFPISEVVEAELTDRRYAPPNRYRRGA